MVKATEAFGEESEGGEMGNPVLRESNTIYEAIVREVVELHQKGDVDTVLARIQMAAKFAWLMPTGRYADGRVENVALEIGQRLGRIVPAGSLDGSPSSPPMLPSAARRKVLHVATTVGNVGGHTRLIANWIKNDPDSCHSLLITGTWINQGRYVIPAWLHQAVAEAGGTLIRVPSEDTLVRARWLRETVQSNVDMIMLHHHPSDIVPVLAFAVNQCPPVAIVNQADHLFWLGSSIADAVIDTKPAGKVLSESRRFVRHSLFLPIPLDPRVPVITRAAARAQLGIPEEQVMLLSIGSAYKYIPTESHNFYRTVIQILDRNPQAHAYLIGVDWDEKSDYLRAARHERFHFLGVIEDTSVYKRAADLYLEGFPIGSPTALLEPASLGVCPVLSLAPRSRLLVSDDVAFHGIVEHAKSEEEYIGAVEFLIRNPRERERLGRVVGERVRRFNSGKEWRSNLRAIYRYLEGIAHEPRAIPSSDSVETEDDLSLSRVSLLLNEPHGLWSWMSRLDLATREIVEVIPRGESFILVDEDDWGTEDVMAGRRCIPFLQRGGQYWGSPADDEAAIREFEQLRREGASFIAFAWPAFWWLEYYSGFHRYLRSEFRCVLENDRLVVFDLHG